MVNAVRRRNFVCFYLHVDLVYFFLQKCRVARERVVVKITMRERICLMAARIIRVLR
jgi:hypothetical protein